MLILGIESATPVASIGLVNEKGVLGEITLNIGLTHSEQLLPILDELLKQTRHTLQDVTGIGVSSGPGSFTGLRIGMSTGKALAQGAKIPLLAVPTLEAMAWQQIGQPGLISPMQNARRNQIYGALYSWEPSKEHGSMGHLKELIPAEASSPEAWSDRLLSYGQAVTLMGDGALAYEETWQARLGNQGLILPAFLGIARGSYVALATKAGFAAGEQKDLYEIKPLYIRGV